MTHFWKKNCLQFLILDIAKSFSIFLNLYTRITIDNFFYVNPQITFSPITQRWSRFIAFEDKVWSCFLRFYIPWPIVISSAFCPKKIIFSFIHKNSHYFYILRIKKAFRHLFFCCIYTTWPFFRENFSPLLKNYRILSYHILSNHKWYKILLVSPY